MVKDGDGHANLIKTYALLVKGWWWPYTFCEIVSSPRVRMLEAIPLQEMWVFLVGDLYKKIVEKRFSFLEVTLEIRNEYIQKLSP